MEDQKKINEGENNPIHHQMNQYPTYHINFNNYNNNQLPLPPVVFNAPNDLPPIQMISPVRAINVHDNHSPLLLINGDHNNVAAASSTPIKLRNRWTQQEHKLFLIGLLIYEKGDWKNISEQVVKTRRPTQVATHAQKYYLHINGDQKKKTSIHDTVLSNTDLQLICRVIAALNGDVQQGLLQMLLLQNRNLLQAQQTQQQQIIMLVAQHLLQMHERQVQQRLQKMEQHLQQETMQQQVQQPLQQMQLQQQAPQMQLQQQVPQMQMQQQQPQAPQMQMQLQQQVPQMQMQQQQAQQMQMQQWPLNPPNNMANQFGGYGHFNNGFGQYSNNDL